MRIKTKRIYDPPAEDDGFRVLIDRLWPRGVRKDAAGIDHWAKDLAPSTELRQWFNHDPSRFDAFADRYRAELADRRGLIDELLAAARGRDMTLLYAAKDTVHNHAPVLRAYLTQFTSNKR